MFKSILSLSVIAAFTCFVKADTSPGSGSSPLVGRWPYTNAEAFARGLPPLRPRHRGSRTWTAAKRATSPILRTRVLRFDDADFTGADGPIPQPYQGFNLGCTYQSGGCGYEQPATYRAWTANSSPNAMFFYTTSYPTITVAAGGTVRLKSLYCTQALGGTVQMTVTGYNGARAVFTKDIACTPNGQTGNADAPSFNSFDLPYVESLAFSASGGDGGWTFDDITLSFLG